MAPDISSVEEPPAYPAYPGADVVYFKSLLEKLHSVHVQAVLRMEKQNEVLVAEMTRLRKSTGTTGSANGTLENSASNWGSMEEDTTRSPPARTPGQKDAKDRGRERLDEKQIRPCLGGAKLVFPLQDPPSGSVEVAHMAPTMTSCELLQSDSQVTDWAMMPTDTSGMFNIASILHGSEKPGTSSAPLRPVISPHRRQPQKPHNQKGAHSGHSFRQASTDNDNRNSRISQRSSGSQESIIEFHTNEGGIGHSEQSSHSDAKAPDRLVQASRELLQAASAVSGHNLGLKSTSSLRGLAQKSKSGGRRRRSWFEALRETIQGLSFDVFCGAVIMVNAVSVGIEVHALAKGEEVPETVKVIDILTTSWYSFELLLRVWADRCNRAVFWNLFDFLMLAVCIMDYVIIFDDMPRNYSIVRFLRFVRVLRVLKMLKIGKTVNNYFLIFSKMTFCLLQSLPALTSTVTVIVVFTYISAVLLTQAATDHRESMGIGQRNDAIGLKDYYGSLDVTFLTLVKSVFNGEAWGDTLGPLTYVSFIASFLFLVYLMMTLLCLLNVVHGVFVDNALQSTAHYKELMVAEMHQKKVKMAQHLQDIFHEMDSDNSGFITVQEFDACLETPGGRAFFEVMGLSTVQAYDLFRLIDRDASSTVDIEEFCQGCMKFMGEAKNFDIQCIIAENRQVLSKWNSFIDNFEPCMITLLSTALSSALAAPVAPRPGQPHPLKPGLFTSANSFPSGYRVPSAPASAASPTSKGAAITPSLLSLDEVEEGQKPQHFSRQITPRGDPDAPSVRTTCPARGGIIPPSRSPTQRQTL
mmetsp:Transcript_1398/g.3047  ORF Transcript_1398/g.3047 Transcript_1398/m.3047 type:complete len:808 (+) Transcript_1398:58-2481(+)